MDALGLEAVHVLGHSMGGINALAYSLRHPHRMRSLILEDSGPGASRHSGGATRIDAELRNTPATFADWDSARRFWRSIRPHVTEDAIDSRVAHSLRETEDGVSWVHDQAGIAERRLHPTAPDIDLWPCVRALRCLTLLVRGADSDYLSRETFNAMLVATAPIIGVEIEGATRSKDGPTWPWLTALLQRRPYSVAVAAMANKLARTIWAVLARGQAWRPEAWQATH